MEAKASAAQSLLQAALVIANSRYLAEGNLDPYGESVDRAVGSTLEFASALLGNLAKESDPYEEIGPEPLERAEAVVLVTSFLERCCELFAGSAPLPFMCIAVRAQTFACFLLEPADEHGLAE